MIAFYLSVPESCAGTAVVRYDSLSEANEEARKLKLGGFKPLIEAREILTSARNRGKRAA